MDPYGDDDDGDRAQPVQIDSNVRFTSIGGLKEHIKALREMVLFPKMYPELFTKFDSRPAKGVLFHGPPGTGKTLLARALANECSLASGKRVTFFMRKGADCKSKWHGQSEKNIRQLFNTARRMQPAIIFFDEIDALAPKRTNDESDKHSSSVVGSLLAEMDGLEDRGEIVIIGATNRPDALDPAVRRAGRFDRELYFPPPEADARLEILKIYTRTWQPQPSNQVLERVAKATTGYLGCDIKALCSEAVLKAVRRVYPQIYESEYKLLVDPKNVEVTMEDVTSAMSVLSPAASRSNPLAAQPLPKHCKPLLDAQVEAAYVMLREVFPLEAKKNTVPTRSVFLVSGPCADTLLAPALLAKMEPCAVKELSVAALCGGKSRIEKAVVSMFSECRLTGGPCVLFVRDLVSVWRSLSSCGHGGLLQQLWRTGAVGDSTLLLAACDVQHSDLPQELGEMFPTSYKDCVYDVRKPTAAEVKAFLKPVMIELPQLPPVVQNIAPPPTLPRAPPPQGHMTEEELARRREKEAAMLRHLRIILRNICRGLTYDRRFSKFAKPVDPSKGRAMKDYLNIIKRPMDLGTMLLKTDMQQYYCAKDFLDDIDLICTNALEYNPDKGNTSDKKVRVEASALRDIAHVSVSEEIETSFELECQLIARRRRGSDSKDGGGHSTAGMYFANLNESVNLPDLSNQDLPTRKRRQNTSGPKGEDSLPGKRLKPNLEPSCTDFSNPVLNINDLNQNANNTTDGGNDGVGIDSEATNIQIQINMGDIDEILNKNVESLRNIGIVYLIELYADIGKSVQSYSITNNRVNLPKDMRSIMNRYVQLANK